MRSISLFMMILTSGVILDVKGVKECFHCAFGECAVDHYGQRYNCNSNDDICLMRFFLWDGSIQTIKECSEKPPNFMGGMECRERSTCEGKRQDCYCNSDLCNRCSTFHNCVTEFGVTSVKEITEPCQFNNSGNFSSSSGTLGHALHPGIVIFPSLIIIVLSTVGVSFQLQRLGIL